MLPQQPTENVSFENSTGMYIVAVLEFIKGEILGGSHELNVDTPLLALGIIDSLSMVSVMTFIRERFGVEVPNDAVTVDNFESVLAIAAMVERLIHQSTQRAARHDTPD